MARADHGHDGPVFWLIAIAPSLRRAMAGIVLGGFTALGVGYFAIHGNETSGIAVLVATIGVDAAVVWLMLKRGWIPWLSRALGGA